ncbi:Helix-turn-helix type 11 domain-containing protein [Nocardioides dubius]|uniref:hypothetical protein n=2 Tax=Nocardioides dubius TaxID=317019 RepID=UPI0039EB1F2A
MFNGLSRLPLKLHKPIAIGAFLAAGFCVFAGGLTLLIMTDPPEQKCKGHLWAKKCVDLPKDNTAEIVTAVIFFSISLLLLVAALKLLTSEGRLKRYLPILKGVESLDVQRIVDITGSRRAIIYRDLQALIDAHMVADLYIDYGADRVINKRYIPGASRKVVVKCTECRANNEVAIGITKVCSFCRQPLLLGDYRRS